MSAIPVKVTDASVRECVLWANLAIRGLDTNAVGTSMTVAINEAYDRWLAEVAKAARVEALNDAASDMNARHAELNDYRDDDGLLIQRHDYDTGRDYGEALAKAWLRDRAARIEAGEGA